MLRAAADAGPKTVAVAAANDRETFAAVIEAKKLDVAEPVLVGHREWMDSLLKKLGERPGEFRCIHEPDSAAAAWVAVALVVAGEADILMKGKDTRRRGGHLMVMSDGGINIAPGIREKLEIIRNAVTVARRLGIRRPKVALLSGSERVHPDFQSTIDAVALVKMCQQGEAGDCVVDGPFALDNAIDAVSARAKGIESPVAGRADVLIMPSLEACNIFGKGLQYYAGLELAHVAMGAKAPLLIPSRTAHAKTKLYSLALAVLVCSQKKKARRE